MEQNKTYHLKELRFYVEDFTPRVYVKYTKKHDKHFEDIERDLPISPLANNEMISPNDYGLEIIKRIECL